MKIWCKRQNCLAVFLMLAAFAILMLPTTKVKAAETGILSAESQDFSAIDNFWNDFTIENYALNDFTIENYAFAENPFYQTRRSRAYYIRCSSKGYNRNFCDTGRRTSGRVSLYKRHSRTPCVRGRNWGTDGRQGIWVKDGCRATFRVEPSRVRIGWW